MNKWYGRVGFMNTVYDSAHRGTFKEQFTLREYYGDILRMSQRWQTVADKTNDDVSVSHRISIVSDPFAAQHFHEIRFVEWLGTRYKAESVEVEYPRIIISLGGVYHGDPN